MKPAVFAAIALAANTMPTVDAHAATLVVGSGWQTFYFGSTGSSIYAPSGDTTYTFSLAQAAELQVTDAFSIGDTFRFFNFGTAIGSTGAFNAAGPATSDAATAFAGSSYSKMSVLLGPGNYSLTGIATASPYGGGGAFIQLARVENAIPEPSTWALMIAGYLLVGGCMRYRGRKLNAGYY
ncbi:MAG: PEPxxWA-CTERM sorting domain-containing protein [Pseudomonadota bacterium]